MIFLLFDLPADNPGGHGSASVWIDTDDVDTAKRVAEEKLSADGYSGFVLLDAMPSTRDDYFPPCKSLDAFERANRDGFAINYA